MRTVRACLVERTLSSSCSFPTRVAKVSSSLSRQLRNPFERQYPFEDRFVARRCSSNRGRTFVIAREHRHFGVFKRRETRKNDARSCKIVHEHLSVTFLFLEGKKKPLKTLVAIFLPPPSPFDIYSPSSLVIFFLFFSLVSRNETESHGERIAERRNLN